MLIEFRRAALALLVGAPLLGASQTLTWPQQGQLVKEGVALHDKQDYPGAIAKYEAVTPGDTTYAWAQSELAISLHSAGQHEKAIAAARRALALNPFEPQTYNALADSQEELKQVDAALATYQQGLKLFPYNFSFYFNQGLTLLRLNRTAEALASLQHGLELNPGHPASHRLLGLLAAQQGHTSHALISWLTYLAVNDVPESTREVLIQTERLSQGAPVVEASERVKPVSANAAFAELDQLLESKVALQKSYESKVKFEAAIVKQAQLLVEKFPVDGPADDFWVRAYGPMVAALRRDDHLTAFTYSLLTTADDPKAKQWVKANKAKVDKMMAAAFGPLLTLRLQQQVVGGVPGQRLPGWFDDNGTLEGLGAGSNASGTFVAGAGDWIALNSNGAVETTGRFTAAGKQTGPWKVLRPDGTLEKTFVYNEQGERNGPAREFYPNGQTSLELTYKQGKIDGPFTLYDECGTRTEVRTFVAGDLNGPYATYYPTGQVRYRATTRADKMEGLEEGFYIDGTPEYSKTYVAGQQQGPYSTYYPDKNLEKKGSFDKDQWHGLYTEYHPNGAVYETGSYEHGKRTGVWRTYFATGKLSVEQTYDAAGELHGTYHDYDEQGHLYSDTEYAHGRTTRLQYFDQASKVLLDQPLKKGRTPVKALNPEGMLLATGAFTDGLMTGEWKWFYRDGGLRETTRYNDKGSKNGTSEFHFQNGQLQRRTRYADGREEGYYEEFTADGQPSQTGYNQGGQRQGPWKNYYSNGRISEEYEYHKGAQNGPSRSYAPGGKLTQERLYAYDKLRRISTYDSTGQVMTLVELKPDSKEFTLRYPSGKPLFRTGVNCYSSYGASAWLRPDGTVESSYAQVDGRRQGPFQSFFAGGKPERTGAYYANQANGEWNTNYPSGQLRAKGKYRNNQEEGEWTTYFPNGQVESVEQYQGGERHGLSRRYNPAGELYAEKQYFHGDLLNFRGPGAATAPFQPLVNLAGPVKTTFANGKPALDESFSHNQPQGTSTAYYASGEVFRRISYKNGLRSGLLESFYPGGKPLEKEYYLHGQLHGRCRYYRPDGTLEREVSYLSGEPSGPSTTFDAAGKPIRTEVYWNLMVYDKK